MASEKASTILKNAAFFNERNAQKRGTFRLLNRFRERIRHPQSRQRMLAKIHRTTRSRHDLRSHQASAVLGHAKREVVIQAEAGRAVETLGQRISLVRGLIGHVESKGHMAVTVRLSAGRCVEAYVCRDFWPHRLEGFYAEQLHAFCTSSPL